MGKASFGVLFFLQTKQFRNIHVNELHEFSRILCVKNFKFLCNTYVLHKASILIQVTL